MALVFTPKGWKDLPDRSTPDDAAAKIDQEQRLSAYTDAKVAELAAAPPYANAITDGVETMERGHANQEILLVTQAPKYNYFTAHQSISVTKFRYYTGSQAASGLTLARFTLHVIESNGNLTLVARSASNTSEANSTNGEFTPAFSTTGGYPASYSIVAGTRYVIGALFVGTTMPKIWGKGLGPAAMFAKDPIMVKKQTGQSDVSASITSLTNDLSPIYVSVVA